MQKIPNGDRFNVIDHLDYPFRALGTACHKDRRRYAELREKYAQQAERLLVKPVHILKDKEERLPPVEARREAGKHLSHRKDVPLLDERRTAALFVGDAVKVAR